MEKYLVLTKLFSVSARLSADKMQHEEAALKAKGEPTPEEKAAREEVKRMSSSARQMLCYLTNNPITNQRTIAKQLNISAQAVSETIKKLQQGGYITKTCGAQNNENIIGLTPKGEEVASKLNSRIRSHAEDVFEQFNEAELEQLDALLSKLIR